METIAETTQRMQKRNNIIISNLPEQESGSFAERYEKDKEMVTNLLKEFKEESFIHTSVKRIGKKIGLRPRLIRVECSTSHAKTDILRAAKVLKNSSNYNHVYIRPDLTRRQQNEEHSLRSEMRKRRENGEDVVIHRGMVMKRDQQAFHSRFYQ